MPIYNNNDENKSYASSGVGTTALVLSSVATAAVTGLIGGGNGLGGLFGGNQNPANNATYQLAQKDNEIALLRAQQYSDNKDAVILDKLSKIDSRVIALETAAPLREQIFMGGLANLSEKVNAICRPCVPNYALNPGYGPAMVAPMPPPFPPVVAPTVNGGTTANSTTTSAAA